jgi:hypothetical protein
MLMHFVVMYDKKIVVQICENIEPKASKVKNRLPKYRFYNLLQSINRD